MKILKTLEVKTPTRGTKESAGLDFYVPESTPAFCEAFKEKNPKIHFDEVSGILLYPHERVNIPSGIKLEVPYGYALIAYNKSGVSLKYGLDIGASVVDSDYTGMVHLSLVNTSDDIVKIEFGQKIIQFLLLPVLFEDVEEVTSEQELFTRESERGEGGFGSTGTK